MQDCWIEELADVTCNDRDAHAEFSCTYSNPKARVRWYRNSLEVFHGHKYNFAFDEGTFRLVLHRVTLDDRARYTCQADDRETTGFLNVLGQLELGLFTRKRFS